MLGIKDLEKVPGFMGADEAESLHQMARYARDRSGGDALACEIGAYCGLTTVILADQMRVWSIDLWGDLFHGTENLDQVGLQTWQSFIGEMKSRGFIPDRVKPICSTSDFLRDIREPLFDLILVDAEHLYEWCLKDLRNSTRLALPGCVLAVHDFIPSREIDSGYGVHQACETWLSETPGWEDAGLVTTMKFYRKTEA